jgi:hypothetical protein
MKSVEIIFISLPKILSNDSNKRHTTGALSDKIGG